MSRIITEEMRASGIRSIVIAGNGKEYCVDTADTFDAGFETMVFPFRNGAIKPEKALYARRYSDMDSALSGHNAAVQNIDWVIQAYNDFASKEAKPSAS